MHFQTIRFWFLTSTGFAFSANFSCRENEVFMECGSACAPTCQIPHPRDCPPVCIEGCFCQQGYIKENIDGSCIPNDKCKEVCRENEYFNDCGTACPDMCFQQETPPCEKSCSQGCFCKEGLILSIGTQYCVQPEMCILEN